MAVRYVSATPVAPCYADVVILHRNRKSFGTRKGVWAILLLLPFALIACHREERAVEGAAHHAVNAAERAQANAAELDQERAAVDLIPLPTQSMYRDVHDPSQWSNPFLSVGPRYVDLRILFADVNTSSLGRGTLLRPESARRQEMQLRISEVGKAVSDIPPGAWRYGRVIAVAESPEAQAGDRTLVRRNMEAVIRELNNLGITIEEWPSS